LIDKIFDQHRLEVSIISCGDTGQEIGGKISKTLRDHGAIVKAMTVTSSLEKDHDDDGFDSHVWIDEKNDGFAKILKDGINAANENIEMIDESVKKIIPEDIKGLLIITTGAGATGLGCSLIIAKLLYEKYNRSPPILTLLPESFENSRVQYNISLFMHEIVFKEENYGNPILLLDNKANLKEYDMPFSHVARSRLNVIPTAFADLLYASYEEFVTEEFSSGADDLYDVMHTPGISVFISENLSDKGNQIKASRFSDVIAESVMSTTALSEEQVFDAKNAYFGLFNVEDSNESLSFQIEFEARKLFRAFREVNPFIKIVKTNEIYGSEAKLRGIVSGLPLPNRALQIMRIARKSRKDMIIKEYQLSKEKIDVNIAKLEKMEDELKSYF
jgi:hypothetical protein